METLPLVLDVIKLLLQVIFYTLEALYRLIIPVKPTPVKEELVLVSFFYINLMYHYTYCELKKKQVDVTTCLTFLTRIAVCFSEFIRFNIML